MAHITIIFSLRHNHDAGISDDVTTGIGLQIVTNLTSGFDQIVTIDNGSSNQYRGG